MKATVKNKHEKLIKNWDNAQLVISNTGMIVQTTGFHERDVFSGVQITNENKQVDVQYNCFWNKSFFKPFHGTITLEND